MKKICICVPTRNNYVGLEVYLNVTKSIYVNDCLGVYIFDSSPKTESIAIENLITKYINEGYSNLHYVCLPEEYNLADKMDAILSCQYLQEKYEYIWPVKDRTFFDKQSMDEIIRELQNAPDLLLLVPGKGVMSVYDDIGLFYRDCGSCITSLETSIYRYDTILKNYSFDLYPDTRNDKYMSWWSPFLFCTHSIAHLDKPKLHVLDGNKVIFSTIDGKKMTWKEDIFKIWIECWIKVNEELPSIYNPYKDIVIKKSASLPWILGSREHLIELYASGVLTKDSLNLFTVEQWERVSIVPYKVLSGIVDDIYDIYHDLTVFSETKVQLFELSDKLLDLIPEEDFVSYRYLLEDVVIGIKGMIKKNICDYRFDKVLLGTVNDIDNEIMTSESKADALKYIQMLMNICMLTER